MKKSKKYKLNSADIKSIAITLSLAVAAYAMGQVIELIPYIDFGQNDEIITFVILGLLKAGQKALQGK